MKDNLQKALEDYVGPTGLSILQKALKQANLKTEDLTEHMNSLQIFPRAILAWAFNVAKNLSESSKNYSIPSTEYVLNIKKTEDKKFDFEILKKTEQIVAQSSVELPVLVLKLFELTGSLDVVEKYFNNESHDLQKVVNGLVEKFLFDKPKITVILNKNEGIAKCSDCGETIRIDEDKQKLCMCFRVMGKSLHVKKNENGGLNVSFSGKWDRQNIYLLMKTLKTKV